MTWSLLGSLLSLACTPASSPTTTTPAIDSTAAPLPTDPALPGGTPHMTNGVASGNRLVSGSVDLRAAPMAIDLEAPAEWVVGAPVDGGIVWVVVDAAGAVQAFIESGGTVEPYDVGTRTLPAGMPPTLLAGGATASLFDPTRIRTDLAPFAGHAVIEGTPIVVAADGTVQVGAEILDGVAALPDTRVVASDNGMVALLTDPTDRFRHAVLGDAVEAESVTVVEVATGEVVAALDAPDDTVFEAVSPLWADVDGDGDDEIVVTASDAAAGARLTVFRADGALLAQSAPIGRGSRWLNQLGAGPVGPDGELEIVEVKTPHIGGIVQWYRVEGDRLVRVASASGFSTHGIFSRNLDEGLIVDVDADRRPEVVVPTQDDRRLVALGRVGDAAITVVEVELPAPPSSNLTGVTRPDGTASLALGTADGRLLIWP